jgi:hypothetical protein
MSDRGASTPCVGSRTGLRMKNKKGSAALAEPLAFQRFADQPFFSALPYLTPQP